MPETTASKTVLHSEGSLSTKFINAQELSSGAENEKVYDEERQKQANVGSNENVPVLQPPAPPRNIHGVKWAFAGKFECCMLKHLEVLAKKHGYSVHYFI